MELLIDGIKLTGLGLTAVFLFLILVVFIIEATHKMVKPFEHLLEEPAPQAKSAGIDPRMAAAAALAADLHKKQ
ncbi:MAG: OadG family protein [Victivallaceae bacterium]|nr:OadG family protein [Victivallaceae bacterium]NLK83407.1 OadG family protein [Lentisphaerota bacterium]MDD3117265.1 OadG family protein [Victivallaceae bacterium]MDD3704293.1 OadG family protein [Victivallaceae bacterium]MDD4317923.1 OadG family protein [Victivallaceae bacterium]